MPTTLAELTARSGSLSTGQVVTVGVQIARELAVLHAGGRAHTAVRSDTIVLNDDGRPSLAPVETQEGLPLDDVRALAQVLREAAGTNAGLALLRLLGAPTDAVTFARDLYELCPPEPLFASTSSAPRPVRVPGLRLAVVLAGVTVVAGFAGVAWARSGSGPAATVVPQTHPSSTTSPVPDWLAVMHRLDDSRDAAFANDDVDDLRRVYAPGSRALVSETAALRALTARHLRARGLHLTATSVRVRGGSSAMVMLDVVDRLAAYDIVDVNGRVFSHHTGRGLHTWRIVLTHTRNGWRISAIT